MELPLAFIARTKQILGEDSSRLFEAIEQVPPVSIRCNNKTAEIDFEGINKEEVSWCKNAYYLSSRPSFTADPRFHAGAYYVQEAGSMFLSQIVEKFLQNSEIGIDLCAAPGGKSTLLKQFLPKDSLLISNEIVRTRANILAENLIKWGDENFIVTNNAPSAFSELYSLFDFAVVDAPCSGEGMFRKDPDSILEWSEQNVMTCAARQFDILQDIWPSIKNEGILIYSTCTYNREENEETVRRVCNELDAEILKLDTSPFPGITETEEGYRFFPHLTKGEGFFISILRKKSEEHSKLKIKAPKSIKIVQASTIGFKIKNPENHIFIETDTHFKCYLKKWFELHIYLESKLNCFESGVVLAEKKGKDQIPSHQLAMLKNLEIEKYVDLNYENSISYLKKENLNLYDQKTGYLLVAYKGLPLGWVKNLGSRANNLYPPQWKIKMNI